MSGFGERFRRAGYSIPKPLIQIDDKPIISHVIDLFPGESNFIFICNKEHILTSPMLDILNKYCPDGRIVTIDPHKKGPVYAVSQAFDIINNDEPAIINYCDFTCYWDYRDFKSRVLSSEVAGSIPSYKGFHPHSLGTTNYAYLRAENNLLIEIQEKKPFTNNRMDEYASSGTYYFASGSYLKKYCQSLIDQDITVGGEFYCSLVYNLMVQDGLRVGVHEIEHFMQWGTPEDVEEYLRWSDTFKALSNKEYLHPQTTDGSLLIPMAGKGSRFKDLGYSTPKPLIQVSSKPMVIQALQSLPSNTNNIFVCLDEHERKYQLRSTLNSFKSDVSVVLLEKVSDGQATSALAGLQYTEPDKPITISACDHAVLYKYSEYQNFLRDSNVDIIVWTTRGHPGAIRNPEMYGWVIEEQGYISDVSVKKKISDPRTDQIIIGTFTFKNPTIFNNCVSSLKKRSCQVNGEFYIDSCISDAIKLGYKCRILPVDYYVCWGTPDDLKTFQYWQSCFSKWHSHPYSIDLDIWNN